MASCQKVPKFDFQCQFSMSNIIQTFLIFFSLKNTNLGAHFLFFKFFDTINFEITLLLKWFPIFDSSPLNAKFNNFLWVCWFLCKNLSYFVPPAWKLHNPYCHTWREEKNYLEILNFLPTANFLMNCIKARRAES